MEINNLFSSIIKLLIRHDSIKKNYFFLISLKEKKKLSNSIKLIHFFRVVLV